MRWPAPRAALALVGAGFHQGERIGAHAGGDGVLVFGLIERADGADGLVEQRDLGGEGIAEEAGDAQRDIDARAAEFGQRDDLVAGEAERAMGPRWAWRR